MANVKNNLNTEIRTITGNNPKDCIRCAVLMAQYGSSFFLPEGYSEEQFNEFMEICKTYYENPKYYNVRMWFHSGSWAEEHIVESFGRYLEYHHAPNIPPSLLKK